MNEMQREFDEAMRETYRVAHQHGYRATRFLQLIESHGGGLPAAKYLLSTGTEVQSGLDRLWELDLLKHSMEALVLEERFQDLFDDRERDVARQRLAARPRRRATDR